MSEDSEPRKHTDSLLPTRYPSTRRRRLLVLAVTVATISLGLWASWRLGESSSVTPVASDPTSEFPSTFRVVPDESSATDTLSITTFAAVAAQASTDTVSVFEDVAAPKPSAILSRANEHGVPQTFLVLELQKGWAKVMLPGPPSGSIGWIPSNQVDFYGIEYVVRVRLAPKRLEVWKGGRLALSFQVGIGRKNTPTPGGRYYIKELLQPLDPKGPWGTYAYGLNGYSNSVYSPRGEPGVIGIHGTNEPDSIGKEVSSGCIRLRNEDIEKLVGLLPLGTPVEIMES